MKSSLLIIATAFVILVATSCNSSDTATVRKIQGIPIFINADPSKDYEAIGAPVNLDGLNGIINAIGQGRQAAANELMQDLTFSDKLNKMVSKIIQEHPDAEGVLFNDNKMTSAQAIKFK